MAQYNVSVTAREDKTIVLLLGTALIEKHERKGATYVSQQMQLLAKLLIEARKVVNKPTLYIKDFLIGDHFDNLVVYIKNICGYTVSRINSVEIVKLGYSIKKAG